VIKELQKSKLQENQVKTTILEM